MATTNTKITTDDGWVLVATAAKCTVQVVYGASGGYALYNRASSAPSGTATDGIVLSVGQSITNSYDTPQNSYVRAMGHEITVSVITE